MKKIYLLLLPVLFYGEAVLWMMYWNPMGELNLTVIETNNPIKADRGETVVFRLIASIQ